jgi:hypothetical protein
MPHIKYKSGIDMTTEYVLDRFREDALVRIRDLDKEIAEAIKSLTVFFAINFRRHD